MAVYVQNRSANFEYDILEKFEAGLALLGSEVKSLRSGKASISGAYATVKGNEAFLIGAEISPYQPKNTPKNYDPGRTRQLLLTREEIKELTGKIRKTGLTLVPIRIYSKGRTVKLELGLGRKKKKFDKREAIKRRETSREIERSLKK
ncbi:MAG TPA: SsrA-binding protein SmpB [Candidatus Colwellbacteria bacterium]|nr:SsrA-binding protein SmpB [Candidatus Colwellbacteria bacterium]HQA95782.1 SsrA-binding protein SmpB [Candidatus Colwellbacteria bacterium]